MTALDPGDFAHDDEQRHTDTTGPEPERPAHERLRIEGDWLVEDVGHHTCAGGTPETGYAHENGCGLEPLMPLDALDEQMRARSRFAARILPADEHEETVPVELYAGNRYEHPAGRGGPRRRVGVVELNREQADDLVVALGEPLWEELPEDERPTREPWPL